MRYLLPLISLLVLTCQPPQAKTPPNIVLILIDDLGWADLPAYGNTFHETPNIDRLVQEGMRFTNAYAAAPVCSPTRASIQSGQYPARVGITEYITGHWRPYERLTVPINRTQFLPHEVKTIAESLKDAGYVTGHYGKWHLENLHETGYKPEFQGYDSVIVSRGGHYDLANRLHPPQDVSPDDYLADVLTDKSLAFLEANREKPFFLTLSHFAVHIPLQARANLIQKYEDKAKPETGINHPVYAAMIEHVDQSVGQMLDGLRNLGLEDNTLVVFFSDNGGLNKSTAVNSGEVTTNAPLRNEKGSLYEGGIRVPLIVKWPGVIAGGHITDDLMTSVDLYPTFLEAAGSNVPDSLKLDGISLVPTFRQLAPQNDRTIYFHYPHYHHSEPAGAIRQGDYKLIEFFEENRLELYNVKDDIGELNNLTAVLPQKTADLQQQLAQWRASVEADMPEPNPAFDPALRYEWGKHPDRK